MDARKVDGIFNLFLEIGSAVVELTREWLPKMTVEILVVEKIWRGTSVVTLSLRSNDLISPAFLRKEDICVDK